VMVSATIVNCFMAAIITPGMARSIESGVDCRRFVRVRFS
jgi:hypothetical protein